MYRITKEVLQRELGVLKKLPADELVKKRIDKFCSMGAYAEAGASAEQNEIPVTK